MNSFLTEFAKALTSKDGPLIWGITAIVTLTLGWKFLDEDYRAEGEGWKVYPSASENNDKDSAEDISDEKISPTE